MGNHMLDSDPRKNREVIDQVIHLAETWEEYRREYHPDLLNNRVQYPAFEKLINYVKSLSDDQLDAVFCAYEIGGGLDGYAPPKLVDPEAEEEENDEDEIHRFNSIQEWVDWAVNDFMESKKDEPNWIDYQRDADRLVSMNSLSKCLKQAVYYLFDDSIYFL